MTIVRNRQLNVLLTEEQRSKLEHLAKERGVTASDVVRLLIRREYECSEFLSPLERDAALGYAKMTVFNGSHR